jgi:dolichyl-diphosphooligosaccharide---protein glycosyltransferase
MDLQLLVFLFPAGVVMCFTKLRDEHIFVILYSVVASYFAGVMVRLMLTLTPVVCVAAAIAFSSLLDTYIDPTEPAPVEEESTDADSSAHEASKKVKKTVPTGNPTSLGEYFSSITGNGNKPRGIFGLSNRIIVLFNALCMLIFFVVHCTWVTSNAYSSPSVVLASHNPDGSQHIIDDFREAYYWLRQNTPKDAVVMSWWDYGYQIAGMADRPTLVDNNTWNNSVLHCKHHDLPYS